MAKQRRFIRRPAPVVVTLPVLWMTALLPFDDPNYGLDQSWAALHPYWLTMRPDNSTPLALRITNHSSREFSE